MNYRELVDALGRNAAVRITTSVVDKLANYIHAARWCARGSAAAIIAESGRVYIYTPLDAAERGIDEQVSDSHISTILGYRAVYVKSQNYEMILMCDEIKHDDE
jgi:hypothetical protein